MPKTKTLVLVLAGIVSLTIIVGIQTGAKRPLLAPEPIQPSANLAVAATNGFAFNLYGDLSGRNAGKNLFFSPYSVSVALTMAAEGARNETAEQMAHALHISEEARRTGSEAQAIPYNLALIHGGYASLQQHLNRDKSRDTDIQKQIATLRKELAAANKEVTNLQNANKFDEAIKVSRKAQEIANRLNNIQAKVDQFDLRVANALWGEKTYPFRKDYVQTIGRYYGTGGVFPADFRNQYESVRLQINRWAADRTNQMVPELISKQAISPEDAIWIRLILTNAIYFKGQWATVFPPEGTKDQDFYLADGGKSRVQLMHHDHITAGYAAFTSDGVAFETPETTTGEKGERLYPGDDGCVMLELPYNGEELSMVLIAPRSPTGLPAVEKILTAKHLVKFINDSIATGPPATPGSTYQNLASIYDNQPMGDY